jgi:hypothetical protein
MKRKSIARLMTLGMLLLAIGWTQQKVVSGSATLDLCLNCATLRTACESDPDCRNGEFACLGAVNQATCLSRGLPGAGTCDFTAFVNECIAQGGAPVSSIGVTCLKICIP